VCAFHLLRLHIFKRKRLTIRILPQPQPSNPGDILEAQVATKFYNTTMEIDRQAARDNRKCPRGLGVTPEAYGPLAGMEDMIIRGNSIARIRKPTAKSRTGLIFEAQRLLDGGAGTSWLGKNQHAGGKKNHSENAFF
jgi:hypothetical protein